VISLGVQQTVALIFLYTELSNDEAIFYTSQRTALGRL
jgi:hypothetical protein